MSLRRSAGAPGDLIGRSAPKTSDGLPAGSKSPRASAARVASVAAFRAARLRAEPALPRSAKPLS
jgi:hypothetical protein